MYLRHPDRLEGVFSSYKKEHINGENMDIPRVSIIILNWNGWKDTLECLESLYQITYPNYDVIVVDNGSKDESIKKIKEYAKNKIEIESQFFKYDPSNKSIKFKEYTREEAESVLGNKEKIENLPSNKKMIVIQNEENLGYTEGNNVGIRYAIQNKIDYILLLNNDTIVNPDFLNKLVGVAESDVKTGIVGPMIYYYNYKGRKDVIWFAGGKINWIIGKTKHLNIGKIDKGTIDKSIKVDYITGCAILLKRKVIEDIGFLDSDYFAYFEETDLCTRAKVMYNCIFVPEAKIWHKVSRSTGGNFSPKMAYYFIRNRMIFMAKNGSKGLLNRIIFLTFYSGYSARKIVLYSIMGKYNVTKSIINGYIDGLKFFIKFS